MKLSVVIPLYNKEKYIDRCLKSLIAQDVFQDEYEIIVINDGSKDSSEKIAQGYADKHTNIHMFSQQNQGLSATRNRGLEIATGDYLYFLDADDYLASNVLGNLLEICEQNNLDILGFSTNETQDGSLTHSNTSNNIQNYNINIVDGITHIGEYSYRNEVWWYFIKKAFLLDTGIKFIEGRYMEDSVFTTNLFVRANRVAKVKMDVHRFVKVENSIQTNTDYNHTLKFINDLVFAIEEIDVLVKNLDKSHKCYEKAVRDFKRKQQSYAFTLFIKAFRCPPLKFSTLNEILLKLKSIDAYPINLKIGGIGNRKTRLIYNMTFVPIFNNKNLLFLSLRIKRLLQFN